MPPVASKDKTTTRPTSKPVKTSDVQAMYQRPASFTDLLPWVEYLPGSQTFLLEDGHSVGAALELQPVGTEGRPQSFLEQLHRSIYTLLCDAIPEEDNPWIMQLYMNDEASLSGTHQQISDYVKAGAKGTAYTEDYLRLMQTHLDKIANPDGLFDDKLVTGTRWGGKVRRIRMVLYRRYQRLSELDEGVSPENELNDLADKIVMSLQAAGIRSNRLDGKTFYEWMLRWFNPKPEFAEGNPDKLLKLAPYPGDDDEEVPYGRDLSEMMMFSAPESDNKRGNWYFDGLPHACIGVQSVRRRPEIGHLSAERQFGDYVNALFDQAPAHTTFAMTVIFKPQDHVRNHLSRVKQGALGGGAEVGAAMHEAIHAEDQIIHGNKLFPVNMVFYVRGDDTEDLRRNVNTLNSLLPSNAIQPITRKNDLMALDAYISNLPMNFEYKHDKFKRRTRLLYTSHIARLLPVYGRARGTGNAGFAFWNRGGAPLLFDPLNKNDRTKNAHMLILGPTGAGKSATLTYLMLQMMAIYRPRIYIIEAGESFTLLGKHFARMGLETNQVTLKPSSKVSLPPFADAIKLLDDPTTPLEVDELPATDDSDEDADRDILGEMELAALVMITGGEEREANRVTRADKMMIRNAILAAAQNVSDRHKDAVKQGKADKTLSDPTVLTIDVVNALNALGRDEGLPQARRDRALEMADGMQLFCSGVEGKIFNSPGMSWPDADVTTMDMGIFAREGNQDKLTVAFMSIMNHINNLAEKHQHQNRPTIVIADEGHIITTNPLLAPYVVKVTKMWRKLGAWFWIATQNLEDFPDASKKMLNMMEFWLCLTMPKEEVENIARFKDLTPEQEEMLRSASKEPGKFTEGVVLAGNIEALFRNVPPALALALAMTEQHEKAERADLMEKHGLTDEVEAAYMVAKSIEDRR